MSSSVLPHTVRMTKNRLRWSIEFSAQWCLLFSVWHEPSCWRWRSRWTRSTSCTWPRHHQLSAGGCRHFPITRLRCSFYCVCCPCSRSAHPGTVEMNPPVLCVAKILFFAPPDESCSCIGDWCWVVIPWLRFGTDVHCVLYIQYNNIII